METVRNYKLQIHFFVVKNHTLLKKNLLTKTTSYPIFPPRMLLVDWRLLQTESISLDLPNWGLGVRAVMQQA